MGWFARARKASAGQRVTRSDKQQAIDIFAELNALNADRERLMREGLGGIATSRWRGAWPLRLYGYPAVASGR